MEAARFFYSLLKPFDYLLFAELIVGSFLPVFFYAQATEHTGDSLRHCSNQRAGG